MGKSRSSRTPQTGNQSLSEGPSPSDAQRGQDSYHTCTHGRSLVPRHDTQTRWRKRSETRPANQYVGQEVQTALHRLGNADEGAPAQAPQALERAGLLHEERQTDSQIRLGLSGCGATHSAL